MTTHRGAWVLRAGVVAAMVAGSLATVATPAHADHDVQLSSVGNIELRVGGGPQAVTLRVENRGGPGDGHNSANGVANAAVTMVVPGGLGVYIETAPNGCNLSGNDTRMDCNNIQIQPNQAFTGVVQVAVHGNAPVQAGESRSEAAQVTLTSPVNRSQQFNVKVNGPEQSPRAGEISGVVTDQNTGDEIDGARVLLVDSEGQDFTQTTDAQGQFRFGGQQVAAGRIALSASKDGYQSGEESILTVSGNQNLADVRLAMVDTDTPPPTTEPASTPSATPSATPTQTQEAVPAASGRSFFTTLMIILGLLFVALGVGAIVLLVIRQRRRAQEDDDGDGFDGADDPTSGPHGPGPTPGSHGIYRPTPTQVAGAAGGQTQVLGPAGTALPAVGPRPALAETQTMAQRAGAADQTTMLPRAGDPPGPRPPVPGTPSVRPASPQATTYGAPAGYPGAPAGYPGSPAGYGSPAAAGYGSPAAPTAGDRPGYGAERSYGAYDQPTGRHERAGSEPSGYESRRSSAHRAGESYGPDPYTQPRPSSGDGYAGYEGHSRGNGQSSDRGGYGGGQGYNGGGGYESHGYESPAERRGYDGQGYDRQGYDRQAYDRQASDRQGYDRQASDRQGYDRQGYDQQGYDRQGYDQQGYDQQGYGGGYGQQPSAGSGYGSAPAAPEYGEPPAPEPYYDNDAAAPRSRHEAPPGERRRLDWLD